MSEYDATGAGRLEKVRRYRRLMVLAVVAGVIGFAVADELGYPLVGLGVYWVGVLAFLAIWKGTSVTLFDERDASLERRASLVTLQVAAFALVLALTTLVVVNETTTTEIPERVWGAYLGISALFVVFGIVYLVLRYKR